MSSRTIIATPRHISPTLDRVVDSTHVPIDVYPALARDFPDHELEFLPLATVEKQHQSTEQVRSALRYDPDSIPERGGFGFFGAVNAYKIMMRAARAWDGPLHYNQDQLWDDGRILCHSWSNNGWCSRGSKIGGLTRNDAIKAFAWHLNFMGYQPGDASFYDLKRVGIKTLAMKYDLSVAQLFTGHSNTDTLKVYASLGCEELAILQAMPNKSKDLSRKIHNIRTRSKVIIPWNKKLLKNCLDKNFGQSHFHNFFIFIR